jgi:universal stress protein A
MDSALSNRKSQQSWGPFQRILLATDCSPSSRNVARIATQLTRALHARLHILYALQPRLFSISTAGPIPELAITQHGEATRTLQEYIRSTPELQAIACQKTCLLGRPIDAIRTVVESGSIDMVVVGSHARSGLSKFVLGSVAESAIRTQECPILVAGPRCGPFSAPIRTIFFAADFQEISRRAVLCAHRLAEQLNATVTLVPVNNMANVSEAIPEQRCGDLLVLGCVHQPRFSDHLPSARLTAVIRQSRCPVLIVPVK